MSGEQAHTLVEGYFEKKQPFITFKNLLIGCYLVSSEKNITNELHRKIRGFLDDTTLSTYLKQIELKDKYTLHSEAAQYLFVVTYIYNALDNLSDDRCHELN